MIHSTEDQVIALAAVFQSASLVDQLAKTGTTPEDPYRVMMESMLKTDADATMEIYGDRFSLQLGLRQLVAVIGKQNERSKVEIVRYALTLLFLEGKLNKRRDLLDIMAQRISQIQNQTRHFEPDHPTITSAFAELYKDTISTFPQRIQVTGESKFLKIDENAKKIRALLLSGIRAAVLWRQVGGRRWKLLFTRRSILKTANDLLG